MALRKVRASKFSDAPAPAFTSEGLDVGSKRFKVTQPLTLPIWKWADNETKFFQILNKIHESQGMSASEEVLAKRGGKRESGPMEPAKIAHVKDLATDNLHTMVFGAALYREITTAFPDDTYINKCFKATRMAATKTRAGYTVFPYAVSVIEEE